ncbi:peptidase [Sphingobium sp. AN641]|uniref:peptidase n=1 Tax=Sphingobium sp. AN641 TaxID=3133443 RepID=UPI0030BF0844
MAARTAAFDRYVDQRALLTMHGVTKPVAAPRLHRPGRLMKALLVLHRWTGVIVGAVMTLWCVTGFVMLYVDYPRLQPGQQLRGLSPLHLPAGARLTDIPLPYDLALASARVEMVAGKAVLRVMPDEGGARVIGQMRASPQSYDLTSATPLMPLARDDLRKVGTAFGRNVGIDGGVSAITPISADQWTVQAHRANRPLYRVDYADALGSTAYIAGGTGEVVQKTTRFERFWGWMGSVPHWLYPTVLRQNPAAWSQVVIWTSLVGCFLTATGIWIGISRLRRGRDGRIGSPYRGLWWWHHMTGLVFGLLALSWVASGLLSMNPWGVFDSNAGPVERRRLAGPMRWSDMRSALGHMTSLPADTVRVESAPIGGKMALIAIAADGNMVRLDGAGNRAPLTKADVAAALQHGPRVASLDLLSEGDHYYYAHKQPVRLPVWRAILADGEASRLYIDARTGTLLRAIDGAGRTERWLWNAPHSFDLPVLRTRPWRDLALLPLLLAVTAICATGTWMGARRLGRDVRRLRRRLSRQRIPSHLRSLS